MRPLSFTNEHAMQREALASNPCKFVVGSQLGNDYAFKIPKIHCSWPSLLTLYYTTVLQLGRRRANNIEVLTDIATSNLTPFGTAKLQPNAPVIVFTVSKYSSFISLNQTAYMFMFLWLCIVLTLTVPERTILYLGIMFIVTSASAANYC
jgi:hypothetical protein